MHIKHAASHGQRRPTTASYDLRLGPRERAAKFHFKLVRNPAARCFREHGSPKREKGGRGSERDVMTASALLPLRRPSIIQQLCCDHVPDSLGNSRDLNLPAAKLAVLLPPTPLSPMPTRRSHFAFSYEYCAILNSY